ncbi:MAG: enoyl-CoA hydratase/isomerase family protein [Pseudomonadota bacterium]
MRHQIGSFDIDVRDDGVALVTFSRPPVNSVSLSVYEDIGRMTAQLQADESVRVMVLTAPETSRAWCGGADLNDFVGMDTARRKERYRFINEQLPGFYRMSLPTIAAVNGHAIGIGMIWAGLCDMRVAWEDAKFACPEIDYGLVCGGAGLFSMLKIPEGKMREILFTGRKFTARELEPTGFLNYVLPREEVLPKALEVAGQIARKSQLSVRARKIAQVELEGRTWMEAYLDAQALSAQLVASADSGEGVAAFLEGRDAVYKDR